MAKNLYTHRNGETKAPTLEGSYWFRQYDGGPMDIVLVYEYPKVEDSNVTYHLRGFNSSTREEVWIDDFIGEWYGPIFEPGEG